MPNYHLGQTHNVVDQTTVAGTKTINSQENFDPTLDPEEVKKLRNSKFRDSFSASNSQFQGYGSTSDSSSTSTISRIRNEEAVADEEEGRVR